MSKQRAFTLFELIVTVAIAGMLLALAAPSMREVILSNQMASRTNELIADLNFARAQAVAYTQPTSLCWSGNPDAETPTCGGTGGWQTGWLVFLDADADGDIEADDALIDRDLSGGISIADALLRRHSSRSNIGEIDLTGNTNVADRVTFLANGLSSTTGTITVCDDRKDVNAARSVVISRGGRVRMTKSAPCSLLGL